MHGTLQQMPCIRPTRRLAIVLIALLVATGCSYFNHAEGFCTANGRVDEIVTINDSVYFGGAFDELIDPDGTVHSRHGVGACDLTSGYVTAFDAGLDTGAFVNAIAPSVTGGTVFLGGSFTRSNPVRTNVLAVRTTNNAVRNWNPSPTVSQVNDIIRVGSGSNQQIYLGGWFGLRLYQGTDQVGAGNQVPTFSTAVTGSVHAMALSTDGATLYLGGGNITAINGANRQGAAAVAAGTGATLPFSPALADPFDNSVKIFDIVEHGGHVYYCGDWWQTEGIGIADKTGVPEDEQDQRNVNRFDPGTGAADRNWWPFTNGGIQACAVDEAANVLVVGGHFEYVNGERRDDLATLSLDANPVTLGAPALEQWDPTTSTTQGAYAAAILPDGSLLIGGDGQLAALADTTPVNGIARFEPTTP